jgi:hypothetical protein
MIGLKFNRWIMLAFPAKMAERHFSLIKAIFLPEKCMMFSSDWD